MFKVNNKDTRTTPGFYVFWCFRGIKKKDSEEKG